MLTEDQLVSLPRVQVNVDVTDYLKELDTRSLDYDVLKSLVAAVVCELSNSSTPSRFPCQFLEERLVLMELLSDFSVQIANSNQLSRPRNLENATSLVQKKQPSQVRKLGVKSKSGAWEILATHAIGSGAMSVVRCGMELVVFNMQLVSKDSSPDAVICPISPSTGVPLAVQDAFYSQMIRSRSGFGIASVGDSLMSIGGFGREGVFQDCENFNLHTNSWAPGCKLTTPRARMAVVQHKRKIYAIGGSDGKTDLDSVEVFTSDDERWEKHPSALCKARSDCGAAVLDGRIYAVGGVHYSSPLRSAEVLDPTRGEWKKIAFMSTPRRGVAVVCCNDSIYAIGGQSSSWRCLASVERYNPLTNQWRRVASMSVPRRNACAVAVKDRIYVMGGYNGSSAVNVVEAYDPTSDEWTSTSSMAQKRSSAAAVVLEDAVHVVGGFSGSLFLSSMEKYNLEEGHWTSYNRS
jgi:N-acetylneuraminic acid mutarotase